MIWALAMHRDPAENPGIRVAQVTTGTRCYTPQNDPLTLIFASFFG
jgi:hypothetical protein